MSLPLNVTSFEQYMLEDDRKSFPMTFTIQLRFRGVVDRDLFEAAVDEAVSRHPLLGATVEYERGHPARWVAAAEARPPIIEVAADDRFTYPKSEYLDLGKETGLRIWIRQQEETVELRIQFHHACCDGIGAYRFVEDLFCAYHRRCEGAPESEDVFRPLDPARLAKRDTFGLSFWRAMVRLPAETWGIVVGLCKFYLQTPVRLTTPELPMESSQPHEELLEFPEDSFSAAQAKQLREAAKADGVTLNDLLLSELLVSVQRWCTAHDPKLREEELPSDGADEPARRR